MRTKILTIGYIFILIFIFKETGFSDDDKLTLTVVPFQTIGEFENSDIYAYGLPEAIAHDLSQIPGITIVERLQLSAVLREHKLTQAGFISEQQAPEIGKMIGANIVLIGTVQTVDNLVRVQSRAIKVNSGDVVFSLKVDKKISSFKDILSLQDDIAKKIIIKLGFELSKDLLNNIAEPVTLSEDAFNFYSSGFKYYDKGDFQSGLNYFKKAAELDKDFSLAQQIRLRAEKAFEELEREINKK